MKRILIALLFIPGVLNAQSIFPIKGIIKMLYSSDTLTISHSADSTKFVTNNSAFVFNKNVKVDKDTLATREYARSTGSGTASLQDDILDFQSNKYARYLSKPTGLGLYNAAAFPSLATDTIKLNGIFSATQYVYKSNVDGDIYKTEIGESGYFHRLVSEGHDFYSWNQYSGNYLYSELDGLRTEYTTYGIKISNNLEDSTFLRIDPIDNSFTPFLLRTRHKVSGNLFELWQQNRLKASIDSSGFISTPWGANVTAASTITPSGRKFIVNGATQINTINLPYTGFDDVIYIMFLDAPVLSSSGNIATTVNTVAYRLYTLVYNPGISKWYVSN